LALTAAGQTVARAAQGWTRLLARPGIPTVLAAWIGTVRQ
jgi:hypothetical protein